MSGYHSDTIVDQVAFERTKAELGSAFVRILGYFQEDGLKSIAAVEEALRQNNAAALVIPAHTLKGEARQFGAIELGDLAEEIEMGARRCVENHHAPDELLIPISRLRPSFDQTMSFFNNVTNPLQERRKTFGRAGGFGGFGNAQRS